MELGRRDILSALGGAAILAAPVALERGAVATAPLDQTLNGLCDVTQFGAKGDGRTDDTAAITAAAEAAFSPNGQRALYFPGGTFRYNGAGLVPAVFDLHVFGAGAEITRIQLGPKSVLLSPRGASAVHVHDLTFDGGVGAIRDTFSEYNVAGIRHVHDCQFLGYTGAAISNRAKDQPYWHIEHNVFHGANDSSTMGVALSGDVASSIISGNAFLMNRVHVKLGHAGNGAAGVVVVNNDFIRFNAAPRNSRVDLWVVPPSGESSGGFRVLSNKFGPENLARIDYRVLYADEVTTTGEDHTQFWPSSAGSKGYAAGHLYADNVLGGRGRSGEAPDFITSMTPEVRDLRVRDLSLGGTPPLFVLSVRHPAPVGDPFRTSNVIGPLSYSHIGIFDFVQASNVPGLVHVIDPADQLLQAEVPTSRPGGADAAGFIGVAAPRTPRIGRVGTVRLAATTDGVGGRNAALIDFSDDGQSVYTGLRSVQPGQPLWIEFDLAAAPDGPLQMLSVCMMKDGAIRHQRNVKVPARWTRFRYPVWAVDMVNQLGFRPYGAASGQVRLGRIRAYHSHEPVLADIALPLANTSKRAPSSGKAQALPASPAGYVDIYIEGRRRRIAYY